MTITRNLAAQAHKMRQDGLARTKENKVTLRLSDAPALMEEMCYAYKTAKEQTEALDCLLAGDARFMGFGVKVIED